MGGGRRMYGLSPTSVVMFEKSGDGGIASFSSLVWFFVTRVIVFRSCLLLLVFLFVGYLQFLTSRARRSACQNPFPKILRTNRCAIL